METFEGAVEAWGEGGGEGASEAGNVGASEAGNVGASEAGNDGGREAGNEVGHEATARRLARTMREQDFETMAELLASDVVLESPITASFQFRGREDVIALLRIVRAEMEGLEHFELLGAGDVWTQRFGVRVHGRGLDGIDVLGFNEDGEVANMTIFVRPLPSLAAFAAAVAPGVARRRGRVAGVLVALLVAPLAVMTAYGDRLVRRLLRGAWGIA